MDRNANPAPAADDGEVEAAASQVRSIRDGNVAARGDAAQPLAVKPLMAGTCVAGKYIICDVLGTGGAAVVYAAEQVGLKRVVAFKLYPVGGDVAAQLLERFEREAQLLARVNHENVVAVFDAGSMPDGSPYLIVQRLRGESLATRLQSGPLPLAEAVDLARQVLNALTALSDAGIVHRDVKPGNLVLDRDADGLTVLKLVDFGIAKHSSDTWCRELDEMVGTPHYMAPEQVRGENIDPRADLYALGATVYEMLTGRTPHGDAPDCAIALATLSEPITPVRALRRDCPEGLEQLVMRALAREPSERFASAREMRSALDHWQAAQQVESEVESRAVLDDDTFRIPTFVPAVAPARSKLRRRTVIAAAALAVMGALTLSQQPVQGLLLDGNPRQTTASALQASEASSFAPLLRTGELVSKFALQAGASAAQLADQVQASTQELLQVIRQPTRWGAEVSAPKSEP